MSLFLLAQLSDNALWHGRSSVSDNFGEAVNFGDLLLWVLLIVSVVGFTENSTIYRPGLFRRAEGDGSA